MRGPVLAVKVIWAVVVLYVVFAAVTVLTRGRPEAKPFRADAGAHRR